MSGINENINTNNTCVVCYKNVEIYSIGMCEHPVCYECSTRMRVLCCQNECPICRQDLPNVMFTKEIKPYNYLRKGNLFDTRYNIYFDSEDIQDKFIVLLAHTCSICKDKQVFRNFNSLKDHIRRKHKLHYCELCIDNLKVWYTNSKIFSHERRCYTRSDLAQHRRKGDVDDKSHKGHPLCEFCDQRYMDNDELFRHLRRDHLYCHFCDADGLHQYYSSYDYLRDHFRLEHFLCEEGPCAEEKFTSVFRTDIDLKAHKTSIHGKQLGKAAAKQARTLELEFTLAPRGDNRNNRRGAGSSNLRNPRNYNNIRDYHYRDLDQEIGAVGGVGSFPFSSEQTFVRQPLVNVQSTQEFPTLGNTTPAILNLSQTKGKGNVTIRSTLRSQPLAMTDDNFPALGPESSTSTISKTVNVSVSGCNKSGPSKTQCLQKTAPNVSIHVNHKHNGTVTTRVSGSNIRIRPASLSMDSDFPALGHVVPSTSTSALQWTKVTCLKPAPIPISKSGKVASPLLAPSPPIQSGEDFPTLLKTSKLKKQSIIRSRIHPQTIDNSDTKITSDSAKGKTKKKKSKLNFNGNNSSGNESNNSKSNSNIQNVNKDEEVSKKTNDTYKKDKTSHNEANIFQKNDVKDNIRISEAITSEVNKDHPVQSTKNSNLLKKENNHGRKERKRANNSVEENWSTLNLTDININSEGPSGSQRKRSELKIDNLNSTNSNANKVEDFLASESNAVRPSGFTNPPPGFTPAPPPGFFIKVNSVQRQQSNGLTFTNSSGESYSIVPNNNKQDSTYTYLSPPDFSQRNKKLVEKVIEILGQGEQIEEFRYLSGQFRQGTCKAEDYYKHCRNVMGSVAFEGVFPELLVLLPDVDKQQELFEVHKKEFDDKVTDLELCASCNQVVKSGSDLKTHLASHTLENHFPVLSTAVSIQSANTWVQK